MSGEWKMRHCGQSVDWRTNAWEITPPCGHKPFKPQTTMFNTQWVECPMCGIGAFACYNDEEFKPVTGAAE